MNRMLSKHQLNKKKERFIIQTTFTLLAQLVIFTSLVHGASKYKIVDLGTLGGSKSVGKALNEHGHVVGYARTANEETHAFVHKDGKMIDLGTFGGNSSKAYGINDAGVIVGLSRFSDKKYHHGFVYKNGVMTDLGLGTLGGDWCMAMDINNQGIIVGSISNSDNRLRTFLYQNNKMVNLGLLAGSHSEGRAVNDKGQITGHSTYTTEHFDMHAFIYAQEKMMDINPSGNESYAFDINNKGEITGWIRISNTVNHPFIYTKGKLTEFETLGGESAHGNAINDHGQIVGQSEDKGSNRRAFLYEGGKTIDLNNLIETGQWTLISASDINNKGQITGYGTDAKGNSHAFLMTPITQ